jgi:hypothetical protein
MASRCSTHVAAALGHAAHRVHSHRLGTEDRTTQVAPVDVFRGRAPRLLFGGLRLVALRRWPDDRLAITSRYQVQTFADGRGGGVGRARATRPCPVLIAAMNALKVCPLSALIGWPSSSIGPQSQNSLTFSKKSSAFW